MERWEPIRGYEQYAVSDHGRVRNSATDKVLKLRYVSGYCRVVVYRDRKPKDKRVHRLVAEAFIPNPENKPHVNHIDGDKTNNHVNNLEWVTCSENAAHAASAGLRPNGDDFPQAKLTDDIVREMRRRAVEGESYRALAREFGVSFTGARKAINGESWRHVS